jgi:hypothetical protein
MKISFAFFLGIALLAAGCATFRPTPYQPADGGRYGYSDEQIGPGEYRITVAGNDATSAEMLWDQLLFRAAEITLENGRDHFVVVPNGAGQLVHIKPAFLMPQFGLGPGSRLGVRTPVLRYYDYSAYGYPVYSYPVGVEPSRQLIATATIALTERGRANNVFDAQQIRDRLKPQLLSSGEHSSAGE